ncbi:MAG: YifB family Mg chelatase-like AAA ATPase [Spirochaetota bacterium]
MPILAHEPAGFEGELVSIEVDIRRGIPGVDLVGLAEGAVREARERVRAAVRNSGFEFPLDKVLVSLSPAGLRKEGSSYDLPIALAILCQAGVLPDPGHRLLALGELRLDGSVRPVRAVLPAIAAGLRAGVSRFIVPALNIEEARALGKGEVFPLVTLGEASEAFTSIRMGIAAPESSSPEPSSSPMVEEGDLSELKGLPRVRRALEIAAAGGHNLLLFGPPGSGKTLAARRFISIFPDLEREESIEVTALHSLAGILDSQTGLVRRPPFRSPHHGASFEGLIGGGRRLGPGEASLAHHGVLFLDEAPEFHRDALQSLREPLEERAVSIARAGHSVRYPASFQLLLAANPCPCGNLGRAGRICLCSPPELSRYWRRLGAPLLDRVDLRVPVRPLGERELLGPAGESSSLIRERVVKARRIQRDRYEGLPGTLNASITPGLVGLHCALGASARSALAIAIDKLDLSSRACHSILKVARTIADLRRDDQILEDDILEATQHRRFGDSDFYWQDR